MNSKNGPWIVQLDGSKRRLAGWWQGAWSPNAEFAVVTRQRELAAVDPDGGVRWSIARTGSVRGARWSSEVNPRDTRIAYLNRRTLRLVGGNGKGDRELRRAVGATAPAWRPEAFELAFSTVDGRIELVDTETGEDGVANRSRRGADSARLVRGRPAAARARRALAARTRRERARSSGRSGSRSARRASSSSARATAS